MCFAKGVPYDQASLRSILHNEVDAFCDRLGNEPEEAQMEAALAEMEEELSKDICEVIEDHIQENLPESLQESSLLEEARQEVRHRIQRPSGSAFPEDLDPEDPNPEDPNPEDSIWARAWRGFKGILQRLKQRCWDVLVWLQEKAVAFLETVCSVVKAVWEGLMGFCSSVDQLFRNVLCGAAPIQV